MECLGWMIAASIGAFMLGAGIGMGIVATAWSKSEKKKA